ncbi:MAG TPA: lipid-binding SYLF domain-containing protein [Blastocatellia bacterium]
MRFRIPSSSVIRVASSLMILGVIQALAVTAMGQSKNSEDFRDAASQSTKAAHVFKQIMDTPDKGIPSDLLHKAECVVVFPSVIKAGFVFGARGGRGVASCRTAKGWSAPAFFDLKGGSFGLQIGVQSTDFVLLFMNERGLDRLIGDKFELGAEGSVAAGPVGREAGGSTDVRLSAEILSYSRSKGLFAGLELKGVVITQDKDDDHAVYGPDADARGILRDMKYDAPPEIRPFPSRLGRYSPGVAKP